MSVAFRGCRGDEVPSLQAFFASTYSPEYVLSRDDQYLRWQFREAGAAADDGLAMRLAIVDGEIGGCIGYVPVEFSVAGRIVRGAWAANWMVDDRYRRLGLGPLLLRELGREFDITLAVGGNREAHSLMPRMGWKDFGDLPRWVRVLDPVSAARLTEHGSMAWPSFDGATPPGAARSDRFDDAATALWDRVFGHSAGTRRSAAFLTWRYQQHPTFEYRLFERRVGRRLRGLAVYRIEAVQNLARIGRLVELVGDQDHLRPLIAAVVDDARRNGVAMLDFFCSSAQPADALTAEGFLRGEEPPARDLPMLFQPIDRSRTGILLMADLRRCPEAASVNDWYVTSADGDQDRPN